MSSDDLLGQPSTLDKELVAAARAELDGAPEKAAKATEATASTAPIDEEIKALDEAIDDLSKMPAVRYREALEREGVSLEEALTILDTAIVELKPYQERVLIARSIYAEFKTRTQADQVRLNKALERDTPQYRDTVELERARYHLASSLVRYGDKVFKHETTEDTNRTLDWLSTIPQPAFLILQDKLYRFDRKMAAVFSEGYMQNFYLTPS
jgi:hypothetical protein